MTARDEFYFFEETYITNICRMPGMPLYSIPWIFKCFWTIRYIYQIILFLNRCNMKKNKRCVLNRGNHRTFSQIMDPIRSHSFSFAGKLGGYIAANRVAPVCILTLLRPTGPAATHQGPHPDNNKPSRVTDRKKSFGNNLATILHLPFNFYTLWSVISMDWTFRGSLKRSPYN